MKGVILTGTTVVTTIMKQNNFACKSMILFLEQALISWKRKFKIGKSVFDIVCQRYPKKGSAWVQSFNCKI